MTPFELSAGKWPKTTTLSFFLLAACGWNRPTTGEGRLHVISEIEVRKSTADDVLELIEELRPSWLLGGVLRDPSDPSETGGPRVLINDVPPRPLFTLQFMSLENVREIRYLTRVSAANRYSVGASTDVILVLTHPKVGPDSIRPDTGSAPATDPGSNPKAKAFPLEALLLATQEYHHD